MSLPQLGTTLLLSCALLYAAAHSGCRMQGTDPPVSPAGASETDAPGPKSPAPLPVLAPEAPAPAAAQPELTVQLLDFDEERIRLTLEYLRAHNNPALDPEDPVGTFMEPKVVVLHWTGGRTAAGVMRTFAPSRLRGRPNLQGAGALNVAAHFAVDQDGEITQLMQTTRVGRHTIGLNHISVGIENVGYEPDYPLTSAQVQANIALVRHLAAMHDISHLLGHLEYRRMEGHPYFVEIDPNYRTGKVDPGDDFVEAVLERVADLGLQRAPPKKRKRSRRSR